MKVHFKNDSIGVVVEQEAMFIVQLEQCKTKVMSGDYIGSLCSWHYIKSVYPAWFEIRILIPVV